jgi:ribonuclease HIII
VTTLTSHTCRLTDDQAATLELRLRELGYNFRTVPHARFAAERDKVVVVYYASGKLVVQGKGTRDFVEFILEPEILRSATLGYETVLNPELSLPRIGVDESGKGDFFGPLCIAGVYVNADILNRWRESDIRDSKSIGSDRRIADLARTIRDTPGCVVDVVAIGNAAYNRLHLKLKTVNAILAWGHARVIENLMNRHALMIPPPVRVISDQFASSKQTITRALMALGRTIELVQRHKAESDIAVAAASIIARHEFVRRLADLGKPYGLDLPKGAGPAVDAAAAILLKQAGPDTLRSLVKIHFRNRLKLPGFEPDQSSQ